jgi:hypothetical protein
VTETGFSETLAKQAQLRLATNETNRAVHKISPLKLREQQSQRKPGSRRRSAVTCLLTF